MATVNASREKLNQNVSDAVSEALIIGFDESGQACVWFGGYGFNVYDAARDWNEVSYFTSGDLAGMSDVQRRSPDGYKAAHERMESEGFNVIK